MTLEEALVAVWRQALKENVNLVELEGRSYPVHRTQRRRLRQVDFEFCGEALRGIEQNPETGSRWAEMARRGVRVMQFTAVQPGQPSGFRGGGKYLANVANGKVTLYRKTSAAVKEIPAKREKAAGEGKRPGFGDSTR